MKHCHIDRVFCSLRTPQSKLVGDADTDMGKTEKLVLVDEETAFSILDSDRFVVYLIAAFIPMNSIASHPFKFMLKHYSKQVNSKTSSDYSGR